MSSSATPSPIYSLPPTRIPVSGTFSGSSSELEPSPQLQSTDVSSSDTRTPTSELRAYTPRAALYTPEAPHMATIRLRSLTPPTTLAAFLSTPSPARRMGTFTPSRAESRARDGEGEGSVPPIHSVHILGTDDDVQEVFGAGDLDYYEPLGGGSDNESLASGRLSTVTGGLGREGEGEGIRRDGSAPAVSPQADHPTLQRGHSQVPEGNRIMGDEDGSDTSSVRSRLSTVAEGLSDEERDVEDYLMQADDPLPTIS
ncbi:unnamed protein product [Peniophora sp. CBMAI 1063]|nr:unnamed protein product [Peniophora sp. CBMAI 1063]